MIVLTGVAGIASPAVASRRAAAPVQPRLALGEATECAIVGGGTVKCWGSNAFGLLGSTTLKRSATPITVTGVGPATAISISDTACAVLRTGSVECWGDNGDGELGNGTYGGPPTPVLVKGITTAVGISVESHACALLKNGTVECWGYGVNGELGNGATGTSDVPVLVKGLSNVIEVQAGGSDTCALLEDRTVRCWGSNVLGELGDGVNSSTPSLVPVAVKGLTGVLALSSAGATSCALVKGGNVMCWGGDGDGQLGNAEKTAGRHSVPVRVKNLTGARSISESGSTSCAVLSTSQVNCWGDGGFGQLGNGKFFAIAVPQHVKTLNGAATVAAGNFSTCAVLTNGAVRCWGDNSAGELGNGTISRKGQALPVPVKGLP